MDVWGTQLLVAFLHHMPLLLLPKVPLKSSSNKSHDRSAVFPKDVNRDVLQVQCLSGNKHNHSTSQTQTVYP